MVIEEMAAYDTAGVRKCDVRNGAAPKGKQQGNDAYLRIPHNAVSREPLRDERRMLLCPVSAELFFARACFALDVHGDAKEAGLIICGWWCGHCRCVGIGRVFCGRMVASLRVFCSAGHVNCLA